MADAQVPPEPGDAKSALARRQSRRLSDAEDVAATRLDMFGDPALKEALASQAPGPGAETPPPGPPGAAEAGGAPLQPADAGPDSARLEIPDEPLPEAPASALLPPPHAEPGLDAAAHAHPLAVSEHPAAVTPPEPHDGAPDAGEAAPPEAAAAAGDAEAVPHSDASDAAEAAPEAPREQALGPRVAEAGPFGAYFMMPPGSSEQEGLQDLPTGSMIAPPRFRDELMFVRDSDGKPITADATILAEPEPEPAPPAELPPAYELAPEPPFMEPPASLAEDPPAAPSFPVFSAVSPYPEPDTGYGDASPLPLEPAPPEAPLHLNAAARIAAEADATAAALDNLERLLEQKRPYLHVDAPAYRPDPYLERAAPSAAGSLRFRMQDLEPEPPSYAPYHAQPAPLPPMPVPVRSRSRRSVYLVGFLTGLALSLMAGAVLLFFIMHAGAG